MLRKFMGGAGARSMPLHFFGKIGRLVSMDLGMSLVVTRVLHGFMGNRFPQ